jgi:hypothetical protein
VIGAARVTLKQFRFELAFAVLGAGAVVILWGYLRFTLSGLSIPAGCFVADAATRAECGAAVSALRPPVVTLGAQILDLMRYLPFVAGLLAGSPIIARELESRTAQTAWFLNPSRRRWLGRQMLVVGSVVAVSMGAAALVSSDVEILRRATGDGGAVLNIGQYGWAALGRTLAAFGLGVLVGGLVGRSLPGVVLAGLLCAVVTLSLAAARDQWLAQQPSVPMREGVMTLISTGFAYETENGTLISEAGGMALVPRDIAAQDEGQAQPVHSGIWLESHGYHLVQLGVSQETALGWEVFDVAAFAIIAIVALGGSFVVVSRRRPT